MAGTVGLISNVVMALAYLLICLAIVIPLARSKQLRSNLLGAATALIFLTCAVHHGMLALDLLAPALAADGEQPVALPESYSWSMGVWDVVGMLVAVYYWGQRRSYAPLMDGAQLFQDLRQREQQALEINDTVLQGLVVARMALDLDDPQRAHDSLAASISSASQIITDLLSNNSYNSLNLTRSQAAKILGDPSDVPGPTSRS